MSGVQGKRDAGGHEPGHTGDAERATGGSRERSALDAVLEANEALRFAIEKTQDGDLARAQERIGQWLARAEALGEGKRSR